LTPLIKNTLDWISRDGGENDVPLVAFSGKVAAISATSPGGFGGLRGLVPLRMMLSNIMVNVIPNQLAISGSYDAFDEKGDLKSEDQRFIFHNLIEQFVQTTINLKK
jgi:NAD(P)H-dependent FMN reductase